MVTITGENIVNVRQYIESLSVTEAQELCHSYEKFERDGFIGDEPIRQHANRFIEISGVPNTLIVVWMKDLAFEAFRKLAGFV